MTAAATERVGRYQLLEPIGIGPTGAVSRAKVFGVAGFERQFAIKRFHAELTSTAVLAQALSAAARAYGSLEHPRIARMSEFGVAQGTTFTAVEFVAGLDALRLVAEAKMAGQTLAPGGALALVSQAARAVGYAHGRGLTHLGLAPTNVMITAEGDIKITDFGILAAALPPRPLEVPRLAARIAYLAPEQLANEATSAATDVFALGVLAYELVTGHRTFRGETPQQIAQSVMAGPPIEPPLPRPIVRVLQRCLARSPFERFPDARALADALDAALRVAPVPGTRKDIGATVKQTMERIAALHEGELSGVLALNLGTASMLRGGDAAPAVPLQPLAPPPVAVGRPDDFATDEFAKLQVPPPGVPAPPRLPAIASGAEPPGATVPDLPRPPSTVTGLPPMPIPIPQGVTPPPVPPQAPAMGTSTLIGISSVRPPGVVRPTPPVFTPRPGGTGPEPAAGRPPGLPPVPGATRPPPLGASAREDIADSEFDPSRAVTKDLSFSSLPDGAPSASIPQMSSMELVAELDPDEPEVEIQRDGAAGDDAGDAGDGLAALRADTSGAAKAPRMPSSPFSDAGPEPDEDEDASTQAFPDERSPGVVAREPGDRSSASAPIRLGREGASAPRAGSGAGATRTPASPMTTLSGYAGPIEPARPAGARTSEPTPPPLPTLAPMPPPPPAYAPPPPPPAPSYPSAGGLELPRGDAHLAPPPGAAPSKGRLPLVLGGVVAAGALAVGGWFAYGAIAGGGEQDAPATVAGSGGSAGSAATPPTPGSAAGTPDAAIAAVTPDAAIAAVTPDAAIAAVTPDAGAPAGKSSELSIISTPSGARVFLDGADAGVTPLKLPGTPDRHTVALLLAGHELYVAQVDGQGQFSIPLKEVTPSGGPAGIKVIQCKDKERYYVFVDSKPTGQTCPTERIETTLGPHTVEVYDVITETRRKWEITVKETRLSHRVRIER